MSNNRKPRFPDIDDLSPEDAIKSQIDRLTFTNNNKLIVDAVIDFPADGLALELTQEDIKNQLNKLKFTDDKLDVNIGITSPLATEATLNLIQGKTSNFSYTDNNKLNVFLDTSLLATEETLILIQGNTSNILIDTSNILIDTNKLTFTPISSFSNIQAQTGPIIDYSTLLTIDLAQYQDKEFDNNFRDLVILRQAGKVFSATNFLTVINNSFQYVLFNPNNSGKQIYIIEIAVSIKNSGNFTLICNLQQITGFSGGNSQVPVNMNFGSNTVSIAQIHRNVTNVSNAKDFYNIQLDENGTSNFVKTFPEFINVPPGFGVSMLINNVEGNGNFCPVYRWFESD